ncbi:diguanylate cyclase domain-containing protein [Marinobacter caseinilyticus]|uniref:diguanylate cyclase domain-containing protein n=1 Tax=Marinobacter caseinilyticus TaxID=2692195 RepID=UPI001407947B|nr:diguanylate cyclase [Marinobacter caseinilyticus]
MKNKPVIPYDYLMDLLLDAVCVVDIEGEFLFVSAACERIFGYKPEEMIGRSAFELMHPDDRAKTRLVVEHINNGSLESDYENRYLHKEGHVVHVMWSARWLAHEQVRIAVARDVTKRKAAEATKFALYDISRIAHTVTDLPQLYVGVHQVIKAILPVHSFLIALSEGQNNYLMFPYCEFDARYSSALSAMPPSSLCLEVVRSGKPILLTRDSASQLLATLGLSEACCQEILAVPLTVDNDTIGALVIQCFAGDLHYTEQDRELLLFAANQVAASVQREQTNARLAHMAQHDQLTNLPNRTLFQDRLMTSLMRAQRDATQLAIIFLDLDKFKEVNDTFGHTVGDGLLCEVADRLGSCVRASDTIGRMGGDEFIVLLDNIGHWEDAIMVAKKVLDCFSPPFVVDGITLQVKSSLGIAIYPDHGEDSKQLIRFADEAMYEAKRRGGSQYSLTLDAQNSV